MATPDVASSQRYIRPLLGWRSGRQVELKPQKQHKTKTSLKTLSTLIHNVSVQLLLRALLHTLRL